MLILEILGIEFSTPNKSGCKILFDEIEDLDFKTLQNISSYDLNVDQDLMNYIKVMSEDFDHISSIVIHTIKHINEEIMF